MISGDENVLFCIDGLLRMIEIKLWVKLILVCFVFKIFMLLEMIIGCFFM